MDTTIDQSKLLKVRVKSVYGRDMVYPNCPQSTLFCELAQTKILTNRMIHTLQRAGYKLLWDVSEVI
jgi:hypothetical protein